MHRVSYIGRNFSVSNLTTWTGFFESSLDALFQTALLLVIDPHKAEGAVRKVIENLDVSSAPTQSDVEAVEHEVVVNSLPTNCAPSSVVASARQMLQPSLRPIMDLQHVQRVCFVLLILLGYTTTACANILEVDEKAVSRLLRSALMQLCPQDQVSDLRGLLTSSMA